MRITTQRIMSLGLCPEWLESCVDAAVEAAGGDLVTLLKQMQTEDAFSLVCREEFIPEIALHELACRIADDVLPIWELAYPGDKRPRQAIETKRRWLAGEATNEELSAAWDAAWSAAWYSSDTARAASRAAVWAAATPSAATTVSDAVWAAWDAAWLAASEAAMKKYLDWAIELLEIEVKGETTR